jgi:phosphohistidine swiveling domain-containing protein
LISNLSETPGQGDGSRSTADLGVLASLGPVVGIARLARGEIDRDAYLAHFGHRGPHEFELFTPRPVEESEWLNRELAQFREHPVDVDAMLGRQRAEFEVAWVRFQSRYPNKANAVQRQIAKAGRWARLREAARSEYVRDRWLVRAFALRAGELAGPGDDVFFLTLEELLAVLSGDASPISAIPAQKAIYERYKALPPYPSIIVGPFDPFRWAASPGRRTDLFDARRSVPEMAPGAVGGNLITGSPGSAGQVEAAVRRLDRPEDGDQLQPGEVLVTRQTDVAWTLLFPRAAAVITDVGASLSHAAIVARELGIPAVVGCGNATMQLKTGDRVRVDGGRGTVEILEQR